ncbi:MAG TPA: hypothetical protein VFI91_09110 [Longimicrobiaceae bacterium]|nr:hypothetical protein [Longimicrobiaceae bacterium]
MRRYATTEMIWPAAIHPATEPSEQQIQAMVLRMPPVPPGPPSLDAVPALHATERVIYSGHGNEATRGRVLYKVTENPAKMLCTVYVDFNALLHETEATTARVAFQSGLLKDRPVTKNSMVHSPAGSSHAWALIAKSDLPGGFPGPDWGLLPDPLEIGIAIGNERFGLIHLLAGHSGTINTFIGSNVGKALVFRLDKQSQEDTRINASNGLQALLGESFGTSKLAEITHSGGNKFILKSRDNRKLVIDRQGGAPTHTVTTLYGADKATGIGGTVVWRMN